MKSEFRQDGNGLHRAKLKADTVDVHDRMSADCVRFSMIAAHDCNGNRISLSLTKEQTDKVARELLAICQKG